MTELTLELFNEVSKGPLDDERMQMVFGWLSTIMGMPYLDDTEKKNVLNMINYLETLDGIEVFTPMCNIIKTRLSFITPKEWDMDWPDNYQVCINDEVLTPDDLRRRCIKYVDFSLTKPIRCSTEFQITRRLYSDGTVEMIPEYQVFDHPPIGERHLFHVYGEKAIQNKSQGADLS